MISKKTTVRPLMKTLWVMKQLKKAKKISILKGSKKYTN